MRPIVCVFLIFTFIYAKLVYGAAESENENEHLYTALWVAVDPDQRNFLYTFRFFESEIHSTETDVIVSFNGCSWEESILSISSGIPWLNFKLDVDSGDATIFESIQNGYDQERNTTVLFQFTVHILGASIDAVGIPQPNGRITVLYLDATRGILGFSLIEKEGDASATYAPGVFWIEGTDGLCSRLIRS